MKRADLEHIIRAASAIAEADDIVILGSQAILGAVPDAAEELLTSQEADIYPLGDPAKSDLIDGTIGELSPFHETFGYYAHGVGPETATLPNGWRTRSVIVCGPGTGNARGHCLAPVDLAVSKLLAGREKDVAFVKAMLRHRLVSPSDLRTVAGELPFERSSLLLRRLEDVGGVDLPGSCT
jgi:hypothetical protein